MNCKDELEGIFVRYGANIDVSHRVLEGYVRFLCTFTC